MMMSFVIQHIQSASVHRNDLVWLMAFKTMIFKVYLFDIVAFFKKTNYPDL